MPDTVCEKECACHTHLVNRRDFLTLTGATALAMSLGSLPVMAGPFEDPDFAALVPPDKKLRPEWVRSLFARGAPTVYSKKRDELRFIGMPVGGICCGTVYLGGDGRLWVWDVFNDVHEGFLPGQSGARDGVNYVHPPQEQPPLDQGFALKIGDSVRPLDGSGWQDVTFRGEYPLGMVHYVDPASPVSVTLTAYSPFIPLNADDSGLPVVLCEFTLENVSGHSVDAEIGGWLQNAVRLSSGANAPGERVNAVKTTAGATTLVCSFDESAPQTATIPRPDVVVEDFQHADYGHWKVEGTAFGQGPLLRSNAPGYQGDLGGTGDYLVNSHASAPGATVEEKDAQTGTLTSPPFTIERNYLAFPIGGGGNVDEVGLALIVDGKTVRRATGRNENHMQDASFSMAEFAGKKATIQIYDHATGAWGNVGVGKIVQTDTPVADPSAAPDSDMGTMALTVLGGGVGRASADSSAVFTAPAAETARAASEKKLVGVVTKSVRLEPGKSQTVTFAIAWHFPHGKIHVDGGKNYYTQRFADAGAVVEHVTQNYPRLSRDTKLWHETWYDSTLPHWFLNRTFSNTSILATSTAHRLSTGRFWGWEGVGCCEGTCTHVYHYAQAIGRIFPELERYTREHVDFGAALYPDGTIGYRGEGTGPAVDGQCGRILGVYREHQMSADGAFLHRIWPNVRRAMEFLIRHDSDGDGLMDGPQDNTLDGTWWGKIPWISSLYAAALRACEEMATDVGDTAFAATCHEKCLVTKNAIETQLFDGDYFVQLPEPAHADSLGSYKGCHIDQVQGQSWAWQVGLGRILERDKTVTALKSLYKYNFTPDVGPFRAKNTQGRPYALAGDGGLIMVTNPRGLPDPFGVHSWQFGYFNECMSGFEHQAASHMIAEGLVLEGLAVTRAIHDRYHASRRNPYNEIECSDHYARAMASYGSFVTICGFEYHSPRGHLGFAPRVTPERFRAPFTSAEGWGTYSQQITGKTMEASVTLKHGQLRLTTLTLSPPPGVATGQMVVSLGGKHVAASHTVDAAGRLRLTLTHPVLIGTGQTLTAKIGTAA